MKLKPSNTCGVHIHVPFRSPYAVEQVKRVAQAVIWFEDTLFNLLPVSRPGSKYCTRIVSADMDQEETFKPSTSARESGGSPLALRTCTTANLIRLNFGSCHLGRT